jgi:hypothetical protein
MNNNIDTIDLEDEFEHFRFEVPKGQASLRIDKYLMSLIQNATRNKIQTAATEGNIFCKRCYGKIELQKPCGSRDAYLISFTKRRTKRTKTLTTSCHGRR